MSVKDHYDNHLAKFYSWYNGDFETNKEAFRTLCLDNGILPASSKCAIDLGAGNGVQSCALADIGFEVLAVDFNNQLLAELEIQKADRSIKIVTDDIRSVNRYASYHPELIVCCGDTLPHLESFGEVERLLQDSAGVLTSQGKIVLTFRDYTTALEDIYRFIPVKSDSTRVFTCFLEYFPDKLRVTDLLYELEGNKWVQRVSSYFKTRITRDIVVKYAEESGFDIIVNKSENRIITLVGQKKV